jgi:hypothetical protein
VQMGRRQRSMYLHLKITSRHVLQGWPCESCSLTWSSLSMRGNMYKLSPQPNEALRRALFFKGITFPLLGVCVSFFPNARMHLTVG